MKTVEQASLGEARGVDAKQQSPSELLAGDVRSYALFLDCDGTLLDIAPTPNEVRVPPGLVELLVRISKGLGGALAVLTGRQLAEIDTLLTPAKLVGAGVHGAELRTVSGGAIARVVERRGMRLDLERRSRAPAVQRRVRPAPCPTRWSRR